MRNKANRKMFLVYYNPVTQIGIYLIAYSVKLLLQPGMAYDQNVYEISYDMFTTS